MLNEEIIKEIGQKHKNIIRFSNYYNIIVEAINLAREDERQKIINILDKHKDCCEYHKKFDEKDKTQYFKLTCLAIIKEELTNQNLTSPAEGRDSQQTGVEAKWKHQNVISSAGQTTAPTSTADISESKVDMIAYQLLEKHIEESKGNNSNFCLACIQEAIRRGYKECQIECQKLAKEIFDELDNIDVSQDENFLWLEDCGEYQGIKQKYLGVKE